MKFSATPTLKGAKMPTIVNSFGKYLDFEILLENMDDDIREALHRELAPCDERAFADAYAEKHEQKFGEVWEPYKRSPQL